MRKRKIQNMGNCIITSRRRITFRKPSFKRPFRKKKGSKGEGTTGNDYITIEGNTFVGEILDENSMLDPKIYSQTQKQSDSDNSQLNNNNKSSTMPIGKTFGAIDYDFNNLEDAKNESRRTGKPIFCRKTGPLYSRPEDQCALSHPLVAEAVDDLFVTVTIGIEEPENSISVELLDENGVVFSRPIGGELLLRSNVSVIVERMVESLEKCVAKRPIPKYLQLLHEEETGKQKVKPSGSRIRLERVALFGNSDCHSGEAEFAGASGVLDVQSGLFKGRPVLQVTYASRATSFDRLLKFALARNLVTSIYYQSQDERIVALSVTSQLKSSPSLEKIDDIAQFFPISDRSGIRKTQLRYVPMTSLQKTRANMLIQQDLFHEATKLLSPRQASIMMKSFSTDSKRVDAIDLPLTEAWTTENP